MHFILLTVLLCASFFTPNTFADHDDLQYRLMNDKNGEEFKWTSGKIERLEVLPFMAKTDFGHARAQTSKNPNFPGKFEVFLPHSENGKMKYRSIANADRKRSYCIVFKSKILMCSGFPPPQKGLYDEGSRIGGNYSKDEAEKLAREINPSLR
jgi:hypothetical protein